uniref:Pentatricopeptide repeat-containing protein n=1 Tax=Heterorhabditis bacteriophora TaxID=37862 RepID=A0A1I7W9U0_HETBA
MIRLCRRFMANLSVVTGPNELCEVKINGSNRVNNVKALKRINLPRNIEDAAREYILSSALYREVSYNYCLYVCFLYGFHQFRWKDAHSLLSYVTISPPGLKRSLYICLLAKEGYLDEVKPFST